MRSTFFTAAIITAAAFASATPTRRATCTPNFEGVPATVQDGSIEWSAATASPGTVIYGAPISSFPPGTLYRFEQTGSSVAGFIIRDVRAPANNIVASIGTDNTLKLDNINNSDPAQIFSINCDTCHSGASNGAHGFTVASGCTVAQASTGKCLQIASVGGTNTFFPATCTIGNLQKFTFVTA